MREVLITLVGLIVWRGSAPLRWVAPQGLRLLGGKGTQAMERLMVGAAANSHCSANGSRWFGARCHARRAMIAKRVVFEGRVQGVGFRYTVKDLSRGFDVCGWVKNLPDGGVELQVMGAANEVDAFIREIAVESALTNQIKNHWIERIPLLENRAGFRIER